MKVLSCAVASTTMVSSFAFVPQVRNSNTIRQREKVSRSTLKMVATEAETETSASDFASAMPDADESTIYERIGITEDQLAISVDPEELFKWVGTREDIIDKFQEDNKSFDRERATIEADKFLMDAEFCNAYIKYAEVRAENPEMLPAEPPEEENQILFYGKWIAAFLAYGYVRKNYIDPKFESGEWHLPWSSGGGDAAADVVSTAASVVTESTPAVDATTNILDSTASLSAL